MLHVYIDADSCPVKDEVYRVAKRYSLHVTLVADAWLRVPAEAWVNLVVVDQNGKLDAADDWIAEQIDTGDIAVTQDIILASRCLPKGARVLSPHGRVFTEDSIGEALATRELMAELRETGGISGGPAPFGKNDRSRFLQRLDELVNVVKREGS